MLTSLQKTKYDILLLLLLSQPTHMKFKQKQQQQTTQFRYESNTKEK